MKKFLIILIPIVVIAIGIVMAQSDKKEEKNISPNDLIPLSSISHGHGLAVDVANSSKVYIATHYGLLMLMDDKDLYQVGKSKDDYMGFSPHPTNPKVFFSSGHPSLGGNIGFQKSEDGGLTWEKVSSGFDGPVDFHTMTVSPANPNVIYGWYKGNVQRSTDGGKNFEIASKNILAVALAADSKDENVVYAATPNNRGILVSRDKGATWVPLSKDLEGKAVSIIAVHPANSNQLFSFTEALGLIKSVDSGTTWKPLDARLDGDVLFIAFDPNQSNTMYVLTHKNSLYKSTNNATSWNKVL